MKLGLQMMKMFCESLTMSGHEMNYFNPTVENTSGVKYSIRNDTGIGHLIVLATTTLWFPHHYEKVFEFFTNTTKRAQVYKLS